MGNDNHFYLLRIDLKKSALNEMKVLSTATALVLFRPSSGSSLRAVTDDVNGNLRHGIITKERSEGIALADETPMEILSSDKCAKMIGQFDKSILRVLSKYSDGELIGWACSDHQRAKSKKRQEAKTADIATQGDSCTKAFEQVQAKVYEEDHDEEILSDYDACAAKVGEVLSLWRTTDSVSDTFITEDWGAVTDYVKEVVTDVFVPCFGKDMGKIEEWLKSSC